MEFQGISDIKQGFSNLEQFNLDVSNRDLSKDLGKEKTESLKQLIKELKELIESREDLSDEIFHEAEKIKTEINNFLLENQSSKFSDVDPRDEIREKGDLRHKKIEISELQLNEKINCWRDVAMLKKELRIYEKELSERESRQNTLNKLMDNEEWYKDKFQLKN